MPVERALSQAHVCRYLGEGGVWEALFTENIKQDLLKNTVTTINSLGAFLDTPLSPKKRDEINLFELAFQSSTIKNKILINIKDKDEYKVLEEVKEFITSVGAKWKQ